MSRPNKPWPGWKPGDRFIYVHPASSRRGDRGWLSSWSSEKNPVIFFDGEEEGIPTTWNCIAPELEAARAEDIARAIRRVCAAIAIAGAARQEAISLAVRITSAGARVMADWCISVSPPLDDWSRVSRDGHGE